MIELVSTEWSEESDIFAVRQRGREVADALGLDGQDQVRVATALSEVGRELLAAGPATVRFSVDPSVPHLRMTVTSAVAPGPEEPGSPSGLTAARRLLDAVTVEPVATGWSVSLVKSLPRTTPLDAAALRAVRDRLRALKPATPVEELRAQNADLVATLDQLTARQADLLRVNEELEETNRGVLAMYTQLSAELEETNRGVVALYAELDEKGRQVVEASEAKSRFLRSVSHELRAPVNSMLGLADLLAGSDLDEEQATQVGFLRTTARSLLGLVNELLDLARAESGREPVRAAAVDVAALFADLRGTLRPVAQAKGVDLVVEEPAVRELVTDAELLQRVLRNLLTNAVKFTPDGGQVRLTATRRDSGQHVEIAVRDTGIGIAPEHRARVFEEFFQVPGPHQTGVTGTGLGLPYAKRVTEALGGTLHLDGTPGGGSTFTVLLPAPVADDTEVDLPRLRAVLLVDDDPAFRHVVRGMLQDHADRVLEAGDGAEALRLLEDGDVDVVLLDLRMPGVDGGATVAELRARPATAHLPVVLLTSVDIDDAVRRETAGVTALVPKGGLSRARLLAAVRDVLAPRGGTP